MMFKTLTFAIAAAALALPGTAMAQQRPVELSSDIQVVRPADGGEQLLPATSVVPGDLLQFSISYRNNTGETVTDFVVVSPLSANVTLADEESARLTVSVDGGTAFGDLAALQVADAAGALRPATVQDITHLRWVIASIAPAQGGTVQYRATVK